MNIEENKKVIDKLMAEKFENALIDIILLVKDLYQEKYFDDIELNEHFKKQLDNLYHSFCEDNDFVIYQSTNNILVLKAKLDKNYENEILHYALEKIKQIVDEYC